MTTCSSRGRPNVRGATGCELGAGGVEAMPTVTLLVAEAPASGSFGVAV
jgi:hypothetical protein